MVWNFTKYFYKIFYVQSLELSTVCYWWYSVQNIIWNKVLGIFPIFHTVTTLTKLQVSLRGQQYLIQELKIFLFLVLDLVQFASYRAVLVAAVLCCEGCFACCYSQICIIVATHGCAHQLVRCSGGSQNWYLHTRCRSVVCWPGVLLRTLCGWCLQIQNRSEMVWARRGLQPRAPTRNIVTVSVPKFERFVIFTILC